MIILTTRSVNDALLQGVHLLKSHGVDTQSRNGATIEVTDPVVTEYRNPTHRVLLLPERRANPFFHLMEALWIMAGRQDVEWLAQFNNQMRQYSDDGVVFHAPYGYRLREEFGIDQIEAVVQMLRKDPNTRRAVMSIWSPYLDLGTDSKDIPCNDLIVFSLRDGVLNMLVTCRSNDIIWGAYGANAVQFSILMEYVATMVGASVGVYHQVSMSYHAYTELELWKTLSENAYEKLCTGKDPYFDIDMGEKFAEPIPLVSYPRSWMQECEMFVDSVSPTRYDPKIKTLYNNKFFNVVAQPMAAAWVAHKKGDRGLNVVEQMPHSDWKMAAELWLRTVGKEE